MIGKMIPADGGAILAPRSWMGLVGSVMPPAVAAACDRRVLSRSCLTRESAPHAPPVRFAPGGSGWSSERISGSWQALRLVAQEPVTLSHWERLRPAARRLIQLVTAGPPPLGALRLAIRSARPRRLWLSSTRIVVWDLCWGDAPDHAPRVAASSWVGRTGARLDCRSGQWPGGWVGFTLLLMSPVGRET